MLTYREADGHIFHERADGGDGLEGPVSRAWDLSQHSGWDFTIEQRTRRASGKPAFAMGGPLWGGLRQTTAGRIFMWTCYGDTSAVSKQWRVARERMSQRRTGADGGRFDIFDGARRLGDYDGRWTSGI